MLFTIRNVSLGVLVLLALGYLAFSAGQPRQAVLSRWGAAISNQVSGGLTGKPQPLVGAAEPVVAMQPEAFHAASSLQESVADGAVRFFRRAMAGGGELAYIVVRLDEQTHIELINADGATPSSDASGDTIWADGQPHLARVAEMANAPYAARDGLELLGAMAFGFHGAERTSDEGSVVINGTIHRVNAGRSTLCIGPDGQARIGLFDANALQGCTQAVGAGPVILLGGRIASTAVDAPNAEFVPFNPLGEDFVQLDWRKKVYNGLYPKTVVGVGDLPDGNSFVVLVNSNGVVGEELARALRDMGCRDAIGGDDDSSTQATWRGQPIWSGGREVPDAIGVYVRQP